MAPAGGLVKPYRIVLLSIANYNVKIVIVTNGT